MVYVDDVVVGVWLVFDSGKVGEVYVFGG